MWKRLRQFVVGRRSPEAGPSGADTLTLTDPDLIADFKSVSAELRATRPVCPVSMGGVLLLDPQDVKLAFSNTDLSNQPSRFSALAPKNKDKYVAASVASNILPFLDAPRHVDLRKWAAQAFFKQFKAFEPQIADIAATHSARVEADTTDLLVEGVARRYVVDVIGQFIGVDLSPEDAKRYTSAVFRLFAPAADAETFAKTNDFLGQAREHLRVALLDRRADKRPCLLTALDANVPADLGDEERDLVIIDNALLFLADGVENVEAAIGVVMMQHAQRPEPITPDIVRRAIAADTPGQTIARIAAKDMVIGDTAVKAGTPVFLSLASANDGSPEGDEFTFGRGRHKCLGEQLAITMVTEMCRELTARAPRLDVSALTYRGMFGHKWPRGVLITLA